MNKITFYTKIKVMKEITGIPSKFKYTFSHPLGDRIISQAWVDRVTTESMEKDKLYTRKALFVYEYNYQVEALQGTMPTGEFKI